MAGGFGGDDDDFEERRAQQLEEIENRMMQQMQEEQRLKFELEEKVLENKLKRIKAKLPKKFVPMFTPIESRSLKQALAHPKLKPMVNAIKFQLNQQKLKFAGKLISIIAPAIPIILIVLLILIIVIVVIVTLQSTMPWLFDGNSDAEANSPFGVSGEKFYGVRAIYKDDEQARANLLENYVGTVTGALGEITGITSIEKEGAHTIEITILNDSNLSEIALPNDYDFSAFNEEEFKLAYPDLWTMTSEIVDKVYMFDAGLINIPSETTLTQKLNGIKFFGFNELINEDIKTLVENYVKTHYSFASDSDIIESDVENEIESKLTNYFAQTKLKIRTEKLFIKDFIFENEDDKVSGMKKENYVQMIFMPKQIVKFTSFSFFVSSTDEANFEMKLMNEDKEISLTRDDGISTDNGKAYSYSSNDNLNVQTEAFSAIDTSNLTALKNEKSFFELLTTDGVDWLKYLVETTDEEDNVYLTWVQGGVRLEFESNEPFICIENETGVS